MNNWKQYKLIDVADVKLSNVDKKTKENERSIRLCNYTDVYKNNFIDFEKSKNFMVASCSENEYKKFILREGQVAITKDSEKRNDIGISTYISKDFQDVVLGYHLSLITSDKAKLSGRFLHYWLNTKQAKTYFENNAGGSGQRCTLTLGTIKSIPLHLPNLETQKKIAKVLSDLDTKIELNKRINTELEAMAKLLYDYWFVQFDFPNEEGKPYKSSGGEMAYSAILKREVPKGWEANDILSIAELQGGGTPKTKIKEYWNGEIPFFTPADAELHFFSCLTKQNITRQGLEKCSSKLFEKGTLFVTARGTIGKINIASKKMAMNQSCYALIAKDSIDYPFLYYKTQELVEYLKLKGSGSIFKAIVSNDILSTKLNIPPINLIKNYNEAITSSFENILSNKQQNQELQSIRDWLLPMLMNGQIRVK